MSQARTPRSLGLSHLRCGFFVAAVWVHTVPVYPYLFLYLGAARFLPYTPNQRFLQNEDSASDCRRHQVPAWQSGAKFRSEHAFLLIRDAI